MFTLTSRLSPRVCFYLLTLLSCASTYAAEPPTEPILRLETGMHTARINNIASDAQGRYLVTASDDKTARVWDIATGKLLSTLRPPQGVGNEGRLYAVALSPDGATVAVGGWTGYEWEKSSSIYLFDRASGKLLSRLSGLYAIVHLAYSMDGRYLAVSLGGKSGVRIYRSSDWQEVGRDTDYGSDSYGAHFSADHRLVTSSLDGQLRLYQIRPSGLRLLAKQAAPGGKQPSAVSFSPDGRQIAVGFTDSSQINVLDGATLNLLYVPDATGINAELSSVAWSADGRDLVAGGAHQENGQIPIVHWRDGGRGSRESWPVGARGTLMDIAALPDGSLLFGSAAPAWGQVDSTGRSLRLVRSAIAEFPTADKQFTVARDGLSVGFGFEQHGKEPANFDLATGLTMGLVTGNLASPRLQAPGLSIRDWKHSAAPILNGLPLKLTQNEWSRSLAIAPDGRYFVLGTAWFVRYFDTQGQQQWQVPVPGTAWAVNISGDGRYVVAALGDGTIRWYATSDGKEKLAFFPHADKKRWVAWTPSGYYSASPGGEDLIGWHINNGKNAAADFYPVSRFRAKFYRPDVIALALSAGDEAEALRMADQKAGKNETAQPLKIQAVLPPIISIVSPADVVEASRNQVTVRYTVRTPENAPVTAIRVRVNGQAVSDTRALKRVQSGDVQEITVTIPSQDSEIKLFAENRNGVSTPSNAARVVWKGKGSEVAAKPKLFVLAVGVSKYDIAEYQLGFAAKDAQDFAKLMALQKGKLYRDVEVKLFTDKEANRDNVLDGLEWLQKNVSRNDVGVLFLAGHGVNDADGTYYYMPSNGDLDKLKRTGVVYSEIKNTLSHMTGKALFYIDTCHSGNVLGGHTIAKMDTTAVINDLISEENGVGVFASSTRNQLSQESPTWGNGAFTKALLEGVKGEADMRKSGRVTFKSLDAYLSDRVSELTHGQQTPVSFPPNGVPDFPISVAGAGGQ